MAKRGRKGWNEMSEDQKYKIYQAYEKQYIAKYGKLEGNMSPMYGFQAFKKTYSEYYKAGVRQNVVRSIVADSANVSHKQANAWAKAAVEQGYFNSYREAYAAFKKGGQDAQAFWALVKEYGFRKVVYDEDE